MRLCCKLGCWRISDMIGSGLGGADIKMGRGDCFKGRQFTAELILWAVMSPIAQGLARHIRDSFVGQGRLKAA